MRIYFNHIEGFGKVSDQDFIYSQPYGVLEQESPSQALAEGWIPWENLWYNIRSVRINLDMYKPSHTTIKQSKKIKFSYKKFEDLPIYRKLYDAYLDYHDFKRTITPEQLFTGNIIVYTENDNVIGYSAVEQHDDAFIANQFVWDYKNPKLSLGKVAQMYECEVAKSLGCRYVYILGGYEKCCLYKADFHGMEWWTGKEWSTDKTLYQNLCMRDEKAIIDYDNI